MTAVSRAARSRDMRGCWWFRPLAAVLAVWVVVFVADPTALHACPLHDRTPHDGMALDGMPHDGMSHGGSTVHGGPGRDADHHAARHVCTCPGNCCAATPLTAPATDTVPTAAQVVACARRRPLPAPSHRRTAPEHARPPSVGPPALHSD